MEYPVMVERGRGEDGVGTVLMGEEGG